MKILVTGGTGYIGAHTVVELMQSSFDVDVIDNFNNSKPEVIDAIEQIVKKRPAFQITA
ncbi:MAG: NAD-dependent epimerase/dehydratase family protein [Bacteroidia bacterium]